MKWQERPVQHSNHLSPGPSLLCLSSLFTPSHVRAQFTYTPTFTAIYIFAFLSWHTFPHDLSPHLSLSLYLSLTFQCTVTVITLLIISLSAKYIKCTHIFLSAFSWGLVDSFWHNVLLIGNVLLCLIMQLILFQSTVCFSLLPAHTVNCIKHINSYFIMK